MTKKIFFICILCMISLLSACASSGVVQESYDSLLNKAESLEAALKNNQANIASFEKTIETLEAVSLEYELYKQEAAEYSSNAEQYASDYSSLYIDYSLFVEDVLLYADEVESYIEKMSEYEGLAQAEAEARRIQAESIIAANSIAESQSIEAWKEASLIAAAEESSSIEASIAASKEASSIAAEEEASRRAEAGEHDINDEILFSESGLMLKIKGIEYNDGNTTLKFYAENNTTTNYKISMDYIAINGIMMSEWNFNALSCAVSAGKKANGSHVLDNDELYQNGISDIYVIDMIFRVYNDDISYTDFVTDQITIPTPLYDGKVIDNYKHGITVYDKDGIIIDIIEFTNDIVTFAIINNTGIYHSFLFDDVSINDYTHTNAIYSLRGTALNKCQTVMSLKLKDFCKENAIEKVEQIEWNLIVQPQADAIKDYEIEGFSFTK